MRFLANTLQFWHSLEERARNGSVSPVEIDVEMMAKYLSINLACCARGDAARGVAEELVLATGDDGSEGAILGSGSPEHPPNTSAGTTTPTAIADRERVTRGSLPEASTTRKQRYSAPYRPIRAPRTT
jgi:hypothetical protein